MRHCQWRRASIGLSLVLSPGKVFGASIAFGLPTAGSNYQANTTISYTGTGSWHKNSELRTNGVLVDLMYFAQDNANPPSNGIIVESDNAILSYSTSRQVATVS